MDSAKEKTLSIEKLRLSDFEPQLHTRFRVTTLEDYELELVEVADHSNGRLEQFSLIFTGVLSPWLPQGSYKLAHPQMGECELFLVPNGPDVSGMQYQAVFSRLIRNDEAK
jgi:hypothetical protein